MKIGGHGLREHVRLLMPLFGLITAVWLLRLVMDKAGTPPAIVRIRQRDRGQAQPRSCLPCCSSTSNALAAMRTSWWQLSFWSVWSQLLICSAIAFSALTGTANIYTAPEYSPRSGPLAHIFGHMTFGLGLGTLFGPAMGCLLLWLLRHIVPAAGGKTHLRTSH